MELKRVAITGINGFVGHHLAKELHDSGVDVVGIGREDNPPDKLSNFVSEYIKVDLSNEWPELSQPVKSIIHLAGLAAVGPSFDNPQAYIGLNSAMVTNMCEYYLKSDDEKKPRVVIVSSGAVYNSDQPMPIDEAGEIGFNSPYVVSKILVESQAAYYRNRGLDCVIARPLNHIGPGQLPGFLVPDLYEKIMAAEQGATIKVGNLNTKRDYTDVRDIAKAYRILALSDALQNSVYNLCSGISVSGTEVFDLIRTAANRQDVQYDIDQSLVRPTDALDIRGDSGRIQTETGWKPEISMTDTIKDFIESNQTA